jgi:hypothetical protein
VDTLYRTPEDIASKSLMYLRSVLQMKHLRNRRHFSDVITGLWELVCVVKKMMGLMADSPAIIKHVFEYAW